MKITAAAVFLFAAMGAVATPVEPQLDSIDVRDNLIARFEHTGKCTKANDECKYTVSGKTRLVKCSTKVAANYRCTKDNNSCTYDDAKEVAKCT